MKEATWGVGLIVLAIFGIFLISLFGNITVTNQQDYTALKNTVEAAMYDAIDIGMYRTGFCVCTSKTKESDGKWIFNSSNDYEISSLNNDVCSPSKSDLQCEKIEGEYIIDKKVFAESLVRRFAESVKGNSDYQIVIDDVIEYPPKVSVSIKSTKSYDIGGGNYDIDNHIDAILEMNVNRDSVPEIYEEDDCVCTGTGRTKKCVDKYGAICNDGERTVCVIDHQYTSNGKRYYVSVDNTICREESINEPDDNNCVIANVYTSGNIKYYTSSNGIVCKTELIEKADSGTVGGCFPAGTSVAIKDGYKEIDKLKAGEYVLTYNLEKKINEYKKIKNVFVVDDIQEELFTIKTSDTEFKLTSSHRVYVNRDGKHSYIAAKDLRIGDSIMYADGTFHSIINTSFESINETVYNLEIEDNHNFYVGDKKILVHNAAMICDNSSGLCTNSNMVK